MTNPDLVKPCERALTAAEAALVAGALARSNAAHEFQSQLSLLQVVGESTSNWPTLEFSVAGRRGLARSGMRNVADFHYRTAKGLLGFFIYEREGLLAGMECWAIDGRTDPDVWPTVEALIPLESETLSKSVNADAPKEARPSTWSSDNMK